jgi:branched-chain amino acid transport system permease protein
MDVLVYGFINSVVLFLMAAGFSIVYGISRLPNFAHGALYILTGFATWTFFKKLGLNYPGSIALAIIITALLGAAIYKFFLVRIRGMEASEIIGSFAVGLAIMESLRWRGFIGHGFAVPVFIDSSISIGSVIVDVQRIIIVGTGLAVMVFLWLFTHYTKIGLSLRGIAQDERAAMMLGIDSDWTAVISLALGSALAGLGAVIILPMGNINVETGYNVLIFAVAVCIVGGLGSWTGTLIASFLLGYAQTLTVAFIAFHYQIVVAMLAILVTLILRPSGLLGKQKELEERV